MKRNSPLFNLGFPLLTLVTAISLVMPPVYARRNSDPIIPSIQPIKQLNYKPLTLPAVSEYQLIQPVPVPPPTPPPAPAAPKVVEAPVTSGACGDNFYANYIYMHESGCRTNALNSIGCYGIGQSCPASKIAYCGTDYACQNEWFTAYANRAYGGWAGAYQFWLQHHWW